MEVSLGEWILVAVIGFLVLGPQELVRLSTQFGQWVGRIRHQLNNVKVLAEEQILKDQKKKT
jgi:Sec-independent protein translocase protein TatA